MADDEAVATGSSGADEGDTIVSNPLACEMEIEAPVPAAAGELEADKQLARTQSVMKAVVDSKKTSGKFEQIMAKLPKTHQYEWCLACTNDKGVDMLDADVQNLMNRLNDWRNEANGIMHELLVAPVIAKDGSSAFLKVSAREDTLQYYAEQMKLPMRLKGDTEVKRAHAKFGGMVPFVQENVHMFAFERHKSWTEEGSVFCSGERQKIVQYIIQLETKSGGPELNMNRAREAFVRAQKLQGKNYTKEVKEADSMLGKAAQDVDRALNVAAETLGAAFEPEQQIADDPSDEELIEDEVLCLKDFFPLHDDYELKHLRDTWADDGIIYTCLMKCNLPGLVEQPIDEIRDYFGEQVAMYFAFLRIYTKALFWPTVLGIITMMGHVRNGVEGNPLTVPYSILIAFWSCLFMGSWERRQAELQFLWGVESYEADEEPRIEFMSNPINKMEFNAFTQRQEMTFPSLADRFMRLGASVVVLGVFTIATVIACLVAMWLKLLDDKLFGMALPKGGMSIAGSLVNVLCIQIFSKIYEKVSHALNNWENHRTETQYEDALIMKNFVFEFLNNYFALFFIAFLKDGMFWGKESTCKSVPITCDDAEADCVYTNSEEGYATSGQRMVPSCLTELEIQLIVVFCVKQFAFQLVEILLPILKAKAKKLKAMKAILLESAEVGGDEPSQGAKDIMLYKSNNEHLMENYPGVYLDYKELAIQFGFLTLFAVAFPLAPLLSIINNVVEIRADAYKLCNVHQRPAFASCQDIGQWQVVFNQVSLASIFTNALITAFVGSQLSLYMDTGTSVKRTQNHKLWVVVIFIEHLVLLARWLISVATPSVPKWVPLARLQIRGMKQDAMLTQEVKQAQQENIRMALQRKEHRVVATEGSEDSLWHRGTDSAQNFTSSK